jgi:SHS2 domain-containing protein
MVKDTRLKSAEGVEPAFSEIPHTADYALRIRGRNFHELLQNAAYGLYSLMGAEAKEKYAVMPVEKQMILEADDAEGLLVEWLSELAYWVESESFIGSDINISEADSYYLRAAIGGRKAEKIEKHIKAVTYHNLKIRSTDAGLEATVIFDV